MGPAGSRRIPRAPRYSGAGLPHSSRFAYGPVTLYGPTFQTVPLRSPSRRGAGPTTPGAASTAPVWANARSLATTCAIILIFSSSGYLDVSVPRVRPPLQQWCGGIAAAGFPHSDIRGSQGICPSPRLFAACHVLRRLREPQASPMRPYLLSLFLRGRLLPHNNGAGGPARLSDTMSAVARSLFQLDFFASISRLACVKQVYSLLYSSRSQHVNDLIYRGG